jgi:site-specific recombinase XerD
MTVPEFTTLDALVEAFDTFQRGTRGLRPRTLHGYVALIRKFVRDVLGDDPIDVKRIIPSDVVGFVTGMTRRFSPCTMKLVGAALRSLFAFLRAQGLVDERLAAAIPRVAFWRLSSLPRFLTEDQLALVLAAPVTDAPCARRDHAIVFCLATLGLRPGEVADLCLEDIDWRRGVVSLRTRKTRRGAVLPLPQRAARTIADYLRRERPRTPERRVFVQHLGSRRGMPISSAVVSAAVARALHRAGVEAPMEGAYVFRHTVASMMVRHGTSLKEVADVLGHCSLDTTAIYAKLDVPVLRQVARPWPEVTA